MVIDTSALVAILSDEPERRAFNEAIAADPVRLVSAGTLVETGIVLEARYGEIAGRELDLFLHRAGCEIVPVDAEQAELARRAARRYGKGRHPAGLNYGDLFAYALAKATEEKLLFKGQDFTQTDIAAAI
ncbi:type II toxin-antitoxin system VapC family toxin [Oceanibaculum nanhaiense]|uniref:type II toxin-antitoxin system VapC family toxin n=1 Tax=Oceanibaculum nanhaiense TaxID=1909734 RepID=UPI00396D1059